MQTRAELGRTIDWVPPQRNGTSHWNVSTHFFPSYAKRQKPLLSDDQPSTKGGDPGNLVVVVNRYEPQEQRPSGDVGVTLILAHPMGTHKESWEPTISHLLRLVEITSSSPVRISEIWAMEPVHHGDSGVLNRDAGMSVDSLNYPLDIIELIERRLPPQGVPFDKKTHFLARHHPTRRSGLIGVGQSLGATALIQAALHSPNVFSCLIVAEPFLSHPEAYVRKAFASVSAALGKRKDTFDSKEALARHVAKDPMYMGWDSEVVDLYLEYGAYRKSSGQVCLKVQSAHEAVLAVDRVNCQSACYFLPSLSSKLPVFFIYGAKSLLLPRWSQTLASKLPPSAESVWVEAGHMMAQEKPELLATTIHDYLVRSWHKFTLPVSKL